MELHFNNIVKETFWGVLAKTINLFVKASPTWWVMSADNGHSYREGSKYLVEYMQRTHEEYHCFFVVRDKELWRSLTKQGVPCLYNYSLRGIIAIARAAVVVGTHDCCDVLYAYRKKHRIYCYLMHGMPIKRAYNATPEGMTMTKGRKASWWRDTGARLRQWLVLGFDFDDVSFIPVCSDFNRQFMETLFGEKIKVEILGMARNDALFDHQRMEKERWIGADGKFVITYMPTHRAWGNGAASPTPFINRPDIQQWMRDNNVLFVMKNHPVMAEGIKEIKETDVLRDITKAGYDPQSVIYYSDALITDYSSVWMDYLLLQRPILFYYYDDFEKDDSGCLYNVPADFPGHVAYNEDELFALIRQVRENYDGMKPTPTIVNKYHAHPDGNSCQRLADCLINTLKDDYSA